jgi:hypothetical protein
MDARSEAVIGPAPAMISDRHVFGWPSPGRWRPHAAEPSDRAYVQLPAGAPDRELQPGPAIRGRPRHPACLPALGADNWLLRKQAGDQSYLDAFARLLKQA